jgi:two-component system response regulator ChvI
MFVTIHIDYDHGYILLPVLDDLEKADLWLDRGYRQGNCGEILAFHCDALRGRSAGPKFGYSHAMSTAATPRIAFVEDEDTIRETVMLALRQQGYEACGFDDGADAWDAFDRQLPDLAILDIGVPRMDGLTLCRRLRARSEVLPIIFLTSREEEFDRVLGLEIGADDYLCKPFSMRELLARVKVLLRRVGLASIATAKAAAEPERVLTSGKLALDLHRYTATWNNRPLAVTVTEFLLLQALALHPGHVKTRDQLMEQAYPDQTFVSDRTIDSHIKRLRRKLEQCDPAFAAIETVYGLGYRFVPDR